MARRRKTERERIFGEGNILFAEEKKNREGENLLEKENVTMVDTQTDVGLDRNTDRAIILDSEFAIHC